MPSLSLMFKTVSNRCDLGCKYCYYRNAAKTDDSGLTMDEALMEKITGEYLDYVADVREASFGWQGGEPTLAGRDFFERQVERQARLAIPGTIISNDIQTHGLAIDDDWARLFADYNFLVGISLDGPEEIHDAARMDRAGRGTHARVMKGLEALARRGVDRNALGVVGPHNVDRADEVFDFYVSAGFTHVQFVPQMGFEATRPHDPPVFGIDASRYGDFLVRIFDRWWNGGFPTVSVSIFDALIESALGRHGGLCLHAERCDGGLVIERDGSVYPCDFHMDEDHRLGRLGTDSIAALSTGERRTRFTERKSPLPTACVSCEWNGLCRGGCPRNRMGSGSDILCAAYRRLFDHGGQNIRDIAARMNRLALTRGVLKAGVKLGRNQPCPCGSGLKHKACCGHPGLDRSYVFH